MGNRFAGQTQQAKLFVDVLNDDDLVFEQHGVKVDKRKIELSDPIRQVGDVHVSVWLYNGVTTPMIVRVKAEEK